MAGLHVKFVSCIALVIAMMMTSVHSTRTPRCRCIGRAMYRVTFQNFMTPRRFGRKIPSTGLVFSPWVVVTHSNRASLFTSRGYASEEVAEIAKTGNNTDFVRLATRLRRRTGLVKTVRSASGPTLPLNSTSFTVMVDCANPFLTAISMVAPSPDWIAQINNLNLFSRSRKSFVRRIIAPLRAYDAGVDSGSNFTDPSDPSLDIPTEPQLNIAPLVEDPTDPFMGRIIGRYIITRID